MERSGSYGRITSIQSIFSKLREQFTFDKQKHPCNDDWEIPFEKIRFQQDEFQRHGSQGVVYYGRVSNSSVAIKRVKDISLTKIKHLRELNHKNVINFKGISEDSSYHYILMEWCPYGTLHEHIHSGKQLSSTILSSFAQQIADGMKYLHSKNIIHRDLKPSNILLTHNDVLKISDFGTHKVLNNNLTTTCAGTLAYMAPEAIRSEPYSFPVDVWSYGVVLWEILIDFEPFKNYDSSAVVWAVGNDFRHLPIPRSFPEGFNKILNGCWQVQPDKRLTFNQICMILKGAVHEVDRISKERWLPLQAGWKREVIDQLGSPSSDKNVTNEDQIYKQKLQELDAAIEDVQRRRNKNNDIYLKLQECCMHLQREREEIARREESVSKREQQAAKIESENVKLQHEINQLKQKLLIIDREVET